jgi:hypothetical protein
LPLLLVIGAIALCCVAAAVVGGGLLFFNYQASQILEEIKPPDAIVVTAIVSAIFEEFPTVPPEATTQPEPALPSEEPAPAEEQPAAPEANMSYEGTSFYLDPRIASGISGEIIPASTAPDAPYFDLNPEYVKINFDGYALSNTFHQAYIQVFPVNEYAAVNSEAGKMVGRLRQVLSSQPTLGVDDMPFLPIWPAAQYLQAQIKYFDFRNGSGVRYLTQYGQDLYPVNNDNMFYTFQGLTQDGDYYISAVFPDSHPNLPSADSVEIGQDYYDNLETYILETESMLDTQDAGSFTPDLNALDELIASLEITP